MLKMNITIGSFAEAARVAVGTVVIIDVFRAFTTAAVAMQNGASRIIMVEDIDQALSLREQGVGRYCMGERRGIKPEGFDFGNSPAEIRNMRFDGETLIQTTSNGTRGVLAATGASRIYAGSFISAGATVRAILADPTETVSLIAMGDKDQVRTDEDEICALYLRSLLQGRQPNISATAELIKTMSPRLDGATLTHEDIDSCLDIDAVSFAVRIHNENGQCVAVPERPDFS